jgi:hypothetical protein
MTVRMDLELLQAVVIPIIQAYNGGWSFKETALDTIHTSRVQDHHSSLGAFMLEVDQREDSLSLGHL